MIHRSVLSLSEAITRMAVIVDSVFAFQLLDVLEIRFRVRSHSLERVQKCLLKTATEAHALVLGEIAEQAGKTFLKAHRDVYALDLQRRPGVEQAMTKPKFVPFRSRIR